MTNPVVGALRKGLFEVEHKADKGAAEVGRREELHLGVELRQVVRDEQVQQEEPEHLPASVSSRRRLAARCGVSSCPERGSERAAAWQRG